MIVPKLLFSHLEGKKLEEGLGNRVDNILPEQPPLLGNFRRFRGVARGGARTSSTIATRTPPMSRTITLDHAAGRLRSGLFALVRERIARLAEPRALCICWC